ncbi:unnamed protein product [Paramecium sonneborni]|uniref:Uncharacterized protein n=1 Tax=Paramecium sonneborni TaxID=65129 RepID=A0A8S1JZ02_9CILI|nr:unnamed protein product [Paramecium sonneborni]
MDTNQDGQIKFYFEEINKLLLNIFQIFGKIIIRTKKILDYDDFFYIQFLNIVSMYLQFKRCHFQEIKKNQLSFQQSLKLFFYSKNQQKTKSMNIVCYPSCKCKICSQITCYIKKIK